MMTATSFLSLAGVSRMAEVLPLSPTGIDRLFERTSIGPSLLRTRYLSHAPPHSWILFRAVPSDGDADALLVRLAGSVCLGVDEFLDEDGSQGAHPFGQRGRLRSIRCVCGLGRPCRVAGRIVSAWGRLFDSCR